MKLNWKDHDEICGEARCSNVIGGCFKWHRCGGEIVYGHRTPINFQVRWHERGGSGNTPWIGTGETLEEAKALAQQAHDQAERAIAPILEQAKAIARETLKKAPWATEQYRQHQAEAQRKLHETATAPRRNSAAKTT